MPVYAFSECVCVCVCVCVWMWSSFFLPVKRPVTAKNDMLHMIQERMRRLSQKQNWCITLYSYYHHTHFFFLYWLYCKGGGRKKRVLWNIPWHPCSSWAMTPEQSNQRASPRADCVLLTQSLSAFFGELVKYNCVILYRAVLGWQRSEKLHYSAFYWGVRKEKKGHSLVDE